MTAPSSEFLRFLAFNGSVLTTDSLQISPLGSGFMFGEGVFETVRVRDSAPMLLEAHHARLSDALRFFGAQPIPSELQLRDRCAAVITANSLANGGLKIVVFKEAAGWSELILARASFYAEARYAAGFRLQTVPCESRSGPLYARKTLNYLGNLSAKRAALAAGWDEALFVDPDRCVLEGATTNVFLVQAGAVSTPPLTSHILPGVMRAHVLHLLAGQSVCERPIALAELQSADEVFVTNALLGVMPVAEVDAQTYDLSRNPVTRRIISGLYFRNDSG